MKKQRWRQYLFPSILAAFSVAAFLLDVLTYTPHADGGWSIFASILVILLSLLKLPKAMIQKGKAEAWLHACVLLLALFLAYWESKIPLCPLCDGVMAEDLGFLSHWICASP